MKNTSRDSLGDKWPRFDTNIIFLNKKTYIMRNINIIVLLKCQDYVYGKKKIIILHTSN